MLNYSFVSNKTIDEQFIELADVLITNRPLIANFEDVKVVAEVDRAVAFLSGIIYALNGEVHRIGRETFLFATEKALKDGSLQGYINDVGKDIE